MKDTCRLLDDLKQWNTCEPNTSLYGLVNGVTPNEGVNVDKALPVVCLIVESKIGEHIQMFRCDCDCEIGCSSLKCTCPNGLVCMWQL